jgi:hypothetical protein
MSDDENKVVNIFSRNAEPDITIGQIAPRAVLQAALDAGLSEVMVLGWDAEGSFYMASSEGYTPDLITMCEIAKASYIAGYEA